MRTSELLLDIRRSIGAPNYQARFSEDDLLKIASSQQMNFLVPEIRSLRRDFFVTSKLFTIAQGEDTLDIPERAVGRGIRDLWFTDVANPAMGDWRKLKYVDLSEILSLSTALGETFSYYFENDAVKFYPPVPRASTVKLFYLSRPAELVLPSRTCTVLSVATDTLTVDSVPANIVLGSAIDVVKVRAGFNTLAESLTVTARAANSVTCSGADFVAAKVAAGDIVSLERETSVVQIPEDAHECLTWACANEIAAALGIDDMIKNTDAQLTAAINGMRQALTPRTEDAQTIINPTSLLRTGVRLSHLLR